MSILWVVPSLAVTVLLFALAYGQMRKPDPAPLFRSDTTAIVVAIVCTALLATSLLGIAIDPLAVMAAFLALSTGGKIAIAATVLGTCVLTPLFMRPAFRGGAVRESATILPLPPRSPGAKSRRTPRRAA